MSDEVYEEDVYSAKRADVCIPSLFAIWGWRLSEDKLIVFGSFFEVLAIKLDFRDANLGVTAIVDATPSSSIQHF